MVQHKASVGPGGHDRPSDPVAHPVERAGDRREARFPATPPDACGTRGTGFCGFVESTARAARELEALALEPIDCHGVRFGHHTLFGPDGGWTPEGWWKKSHFAFSGEVTSAQQAGAWVSHMLREMDDPISAWYEDGYYAPDGTAMIQNGWALVRHVTRLTGGTPWPGMPKKPESEDPFPEGFCVADVRQYYAELDRSCYANCVPRPPEHAEGGTKVPGTAVLDVVTSIPDGYVTLTQLDEICVKWGITPNQSQVRRKANQIGGGIPAVNYKKEAHHKIPVLCVYRTSALGYLVEFEKKKKEKTADDVPAEVEKCKALILNARALR